MILAFVSGQSDRAGALSTTDYVLLGLAGLLNFIGGRYSNFRAIHAIGANLTAPLRTLAILLSAVLDEELTALRGTGIAFLIAAPLIAFSQSSQMRAELKGGPVLKLTEGFSFATLASVSYAFANFLIGYVLVGTGLSILGAAVAHAAAAVMLATLAWPGRLRSIGALGMRSLYVFLAVTAVMVTMQILRFAAFERAPVAVVSALTETLGFFGFGFAYLFNRHLEAFSPQVAAGVVLAVVGAVVLTI